MQVSEFNAAVSQEFIYFLFILEFEIFIWWWSFETAFIFFIKYANDQPIDKSALNIFFTMLGAFNLSRPYDFYILQLLAIYWYFIHSLDSGRTRRMIFCLELCINVILKIAIFSFQEILSVDNEQWNTDYVAVKTFEPENKINLDK